MYNVCYEVVGNTEIQVMYVDDETVKSESNYTAGEKQTRDGCELDIVKTNTEIGRYACDGIENKITNLELFEQI